MIDERGFSEDEARDDSLGELLESLVRESYAPPDAGAWPEVYWTGLERRIMARIAAEEEKSWWSILAPWARIGLATATAIFLVTGVVNQRLSEPEEQIAYEAIYQPEFSSRGEEPIASQYFSADGDASAVRDFLTN